MLIPGIRTRRIRTLRIAVGLLLVALALAAGCGGEDDDGNSEEARLAANIGVTLWRSIDAALLANTAALDLGAGIVGDCAPSGNVTTSGRRLPGHLAPAHQYGLLCPDITYAPMTEGMRVFVVYGDAGCNSELTGENHAGFVE